LVLAHLFVKIPSPGDSKVTFSVFESSCHLFTTSLTISKVEAISLSAYPKAQPADLPAYVYNFPFILNVKLRGNRAQVHQIRGGSLNH